MATPSLLQAWDLTVGLNYGQFHLQTDDPYNAAKTETARVVEQAFSGRGIAQHFGLIVVRSPHQSNFKMGLRVEVWDGHPGDEDHWQECFETDLVVGRGGLVYDSPAQSSFAIPVPAGEYHLRIDGRGFSEHGWPGSTTPGDDWRLRLWPCGEGHTADRLSSWTDSLPRRVDVAE
jgi:hypothetical protein